MDHERSKPEIIFGFVRRLVVFGLGCWTIGNALVNPEERVGQLVIGMILVGVLPVENVFSWRERRLTVTERHDNVQYDTKKE